MNFARTLLIFTGPKDSVIRRQFEDAAIRCQQSLSSAVFEP